jgi:hypothetical protein
LEALEDRSLLSGNISGTVFIDYQGTGLAPTTGATPLPGVTVFLDLHNDGKLDAGDPTAVTDASGQYTFTGVADGTYTVREVVPPGYTLTQPTDGSRTVVLGSSGPFIASLPPDFGNRPISPLVLTFSAEDLYGPRPSPDQTTAFVKGLYHALLGRDADSAGLAFWTSRLTTGETRAQVIQEIWISDEHRGDEVDYDYQTFLHRAADTAGRAYWVSQLKAGMDETAVAVGFLTSTEYALAHPDNSAFVTGLYQDVLFRAPDTTGAQFWSGRFAFGASRGEVALGFLQSQEAFRRAVDSLYAAFLHRPGDSLGESYWNNQLVGPNGLPPAQVAQGFLVSDEFFIKAGTT